MRHVMMAVFALGLLAACNPDFVPVEKNVAVDPQTGAALLAHPCPDWSHSAVVNYDNSLHSNYGCAVNNNMAVQLADPRDLLRGRGSNTGNTEAGMRTIELYRAGEIPAPLVPLQSGTSP